tara:strand:+ start:1816 stop:2025 length:210 start_codon:yes stop_codon:yes gene_type:complete
MKDTCICCGVESNYDREDHIDFRIGYISGAGQLCLDCYGNIYVTKGKSYEGDNKTGIERHVRIPDQFGL